MVNGNLNINVEYKNYSSIKIICSIAVYLIFYKNLEFLTPK